MRNVFVALLLGIFGMTPVYADEVTDLGRIVVTPNRYVQDAAEAPAYVRVITAADIASSGAFTVADVLSNVTGVHVYNKGSVKNSVIDMGGYNDYAVSNVLVMLNGRRLNPSDSSGPDLAQIPLGAVERIEVIRGGASVLYGDNAVGGVVNIITKKSGEGFSGAVAVEAGSYGRRKETVEVRAGNKDIAAYVYGGSQATKGYRTNNAYVAGDGQARVDWQAAQLLSLGVEAGWHEDHYGMPGGLSMAQIAAQGRRGSRTPGDDAQTRDRFVRLMARWTPQDAEGSFGTVSADYTHRDRDIYAALYYTSPDWETTKTSTLTDAVGMKYEIEKDIAGRKARVAAGVDAAYDRSHTLSQYDSTFFSSYQDVLISRTQQGYYAHGEYEVLTHLTADVGGRFEKADYTFNNRGTLSKSTAAPTRTVWGGGLKYDYAPQSNVFVRADETFRFLNTDEWFSRWTGLNTTLKNQSGIDYRAGVRHTFGELAELRVTPYVTRNKDEIFFDPTVSPGNNSNYGRTQRVGVDVGQTFHAAPLIKAGFLKQMDIHMNYGFLSARFQGGALDGNYLPLAPRHQVSLGFNAMTRGGLLIDVVTRLTGQQYGINDDSNVKPRIKPSIVTDTRLGYRFRESWEVFVGVNNIFNERYYDYVAYGAGTSTNVDYYPAMDRNYVTGVKYTF